MVAGTGDARRVLVLLLVVAALLAPPAAAEDAVLEDNVALGFCWATPLSAEAARPGRMGALAGQPGGFVLTAPIPWGWVEPEAPRNRRPVYRWEGLDDLVRSWQSAGLSPVLVLTTGSPWACLAPEDCEWPRHVRRSLEGPVADLLVRESRGATPPRPEAWAHWERYVEELVERYDGDGILDMKGLRAPLRYVQVLDRAQDPDRWLGSAEDYLRLLHHADAGGHRAFEGLRLVHAAVDFFGLGRPPFPDADETASRRKKHALSLPEPARLEMRWALEFCDRTLEMPRLFQAVGVSGSGHPADEAADVSYVRHLLDRRGAIATEVWLEESPARKHADPLVPTASTPGTEEQALRRRWLAAANGPAHADHAAARAWLARGIAFDLVRTATLARLAGARRAFVVGVTEPPSVEDLVAERPDGTFERQPSWYAARQWTRRTGGSASARELAVGSAVRAVLFEFPPSHATPWEVVLLSDPNRSWAGDPAGAAPEETVTLRLPAGSYLLEPTLLADGDPVRRPVEAAGGLLSVPLSPAPVYLIPVRVEGGAPR